MSAALHAPRQCRAYADAVDDDLTSRLTDSYAQFAQQLADEARKVADPQERIRLVLRLLDAGRAADAAVAYVSSEAVQEMRDREGLSYSQIGERLGVTRARAQQLGARRPPRA